LPWRLIDIPTLEQAIASFQHEFGRARAQAERER
jgi:hypothetical protein